MTAEKETFDYLLNPQRKIKSPICTGLMEDLEKIFSDAFPLYCKQAIEFLED
jgi:hypothetical protein